MSHSSNLDSYVLKLLPKNLEKKRVLDVGCGYGSWGYNIRIVKDGEPIILGVDIWKPYLKRTKQTRIYDDLIQADAKQLPFQTRFFDHTLCIAVLPHLNKLDAFQCLNELERVSHHVISSTHLGFSSQDEQHGNPFEKHLSSWKLQDFIRRGYKTITVSSRVRGSRILTFFYRLAQRIFNPTEIPLKAEIVAWK